jgi:hypothetical protein
VGDAEPVLAVVEEAELADQLAGGLAERGDLGEEIRLRLLTISLHHATILRVAVAVKSEPP